MFRIPPNPEYFRRVRINRKAFRRRNYKLPLYRFYKNYFKNSYKSSPNYWISQKAGFPYRATKRQLELEAAYENKAERLLRKCRRVH